MIIKVSINIDLLNIILSYFQRTIHTQKSYTDFILYQIFMSYKNFGKNVTIFAYAYKWGIHYQNMYLVITRHKSGIILFERLYIKLYFTEFFIQDGGIVNTCHRRPIWGLYLRNLCTAESVVGVDSLHFKKYTIPWNDQSAFVLYIKSITDAACIFYGHYLNRIFENSQRFQTSTLIDV